MAGDLEQLDELVARLENVDKVGVAIARTARPGVEAIARKTAAAGTAPDGEAWAPKKDGTGKALAKAAEAISVVVSGSTRAVLTIVLRGIYVYHQRSKSKGKRGLPRRTIVPQAGDPVPDAIVEEIATAARQEIPRAIRGAS